MYCIENKIPLTLCILRLKQSVLLCSQTHTKKLSVNGNCLTFAVFYHLSESTPDLYCKVGGALTIKMISYLQPLPLQLLFNTKDSQSTHWLTVGLASCVPIHTQSREQ